MEEERVMKIEGACSSSGEEKCQEGRRELSGSKKCRIIHTNDEDRCFNTSLLLEGNQNSGEREGVCST